MPSYYGMPPYNMMPPPQPHMPHPPQVGQSPRPPQPSNSLQNSQVPGNHGNYRLIYMLISYVMTFKSQKMAALNFKTSVLNRDYFH